MNSLFLPVLAILLLFIVVTSSTTPVVSAAHLSTSSSSNYKVCETAENIIATDNGDSFICYSTVSTAATPSAAKYNTTNGQLIWRQDSIPAIGAGQVHVFQEPNILFFQSAVLNLTTGKVMWSNPTVGHMCFSSYYGESLLLDHVDGKYVLVITCTVDMVVPVWTVDGLTGELLWKTQIPRWTFSHSSNIVNHALVISVTNKVHAFDTLTGNVLWMNDKLPPSDSRYGSTFIALIEQNFEGNKHLTVPQSNALFDLGDIILGRYGVPSNNLFALSRQDGSLLWNSSTAGWTVAPNSLIQTLEVSPVNATGFPIPTTAILIMSDEGQLQLRDIKTGKLLTFSKYSYASAVNNKSSSVPSNPTSFTFALLTPGILCVQALGSNFIDVFPMGGWKLPSATSNGQAQVWPQKNRQQLEVSGTLLATGFFLADRYAVQYFHSGGNNSNNSAAGGDAIEVVVYTSSTTASAQVVVPVTKSSPFAPNPSVGPSGFVVSQMPSPAGEGTKSFVVFVSGSGAFGY